MTLEEKQYLISIIREVNQQSLKDGDFSYCVTIEARYSNNQWMQLKGDCINFAYPHDSDPNLAFENGIFQLAEEIELKEWEPNSFATFEYCFAEDLMSDENIHMLAQFMHFVLRRTLSVADPFESLRRKSEWL